MTQSRLDKLNASLQTSDLDAVIPVVLLLARDQVPAIVLPELELQKVASLPYELQVFSYPENPSEWGNTFRNAAQALGLDGKRVGVEPRQLRLLEFRYVQASAPEADYPDASELLAGLRLRKDRSEPRFGLESSSAEDTNQPRAGLNASSRRSIRPLVVRRATFTVRSKASGPSIRMNVWLRSMA